MAAKKASKKQRGHYCYVCGEHKANEKFSGRGHANHVKINQDKEIPHDIYMIDKKGYDDEQDDNYY